MGLAPIKEAFRNYYRTYSSLTFVSDIEKREFMFIDFDGTVKRHMRIGSAEELRYRLESEVPMHSYYSVAIYKDPSAKEMGLKGLVSAELLFDIDTDLLKVSCRKEHDHWRCESCRLIGDWPPPEKCPECGSNRIKHYKWICPSCLEEAKRQAFMLMDLLSSDLGIGKEHVLIAYTGNRGYHLRVREEKAMLLDKKGRREVADLLSGFGIEPDAFVESEDGISLPNVNEGGWRGRFSRLLLSILEGRAPDWVKKREVSYIRSIPGLMDAILRGKKLSNIGLKAIRTLRKLVLEMKDGMGIKMDLDVTSDPHRFTRIPNSLHGKSGLRAVTLTPPELEFFDPLKMAVGLKGGSLKIRVVEPVPEFELGGKRFGPFEEGLDLSLPIEAAAFIVLKGRGILI